VSTPSPPGYLRLIKTGSVSALEQAFTLAYPEQDSSGGIQPAHVSLDYPVDPGAYPGVWVDFETSLLQTVGIDHTEFTDDGAIATHWRFQGYAVFTIVALNSNECDSIYDQLIALTAFASQSDYPSVFRSTVDSNGLVNTTWSYDRAEGRGQNAAPGTPWGTDEIVYERGVALQVIGEFYTVPAGQVVELVPLSRIVITGQEQIGGADVGDPWTLSVPPGS
jgi:hypothetical protein